MIPLDSALHRDITMSYVVPATKAYKLINEKTGLALSVKQCKDVNGSPMVKVWCCKSFTPKRQDLGTFLSYLKITLLKPSRKKQGEGKC